MSDYIPSEVCFSILTRLPVEALLRCRLVCKSWYSLITSPIFISEHLKFHQTIAKHNPQLLVRRLLDTRREQYIVHYDNKTFDEYAKLYFPFTSVGVFFNVVGICNGLICLSDEHDTPFNEKKMILWNPMIRKCVTLPKPNFFSSLVDATGFGFDPLTNDYKVIRILHHSFPKVPTRVELYSLKTGQWRNISGLALPYEVCGQSLRATMNGAIHWVARGGLNALFNLVILFDLHEEMFREIMLPDSVVVHTRTVMLHLAVAQESLSLICHTCSSTENHCQIWIMKEYGQVDSWTKQYRVEVPQYFGMPLRFNKNGEILLSSIKGVLFCYDSEDAEVKSLGSYQETYWRSQSLYVESFVESLVLLDHKANDCNMVTEHRSRDLHGNGISDVKEKSKRKTRGPLFGALIGCFICREEHERKINEEREESRHDLA